MTAYQSVVHFEMPAKDKKRASGFYSKVFGWNMTQTDETLGNYLLATTTDTDPKTGMIRNPGAINGGFFDYRDDELNRVPHIVISVDNLEASIKTVNESGGKVLTDILDIPGVGRYVSFRDSEDNIVGMLQPTARG